MTRIGLVVPSLQEGGGVPAVAEFMCGVILRSGRFTVRLISLSTTSVDDVGVAISRPSSWFRGVQTNEGIWRGHAFTHVGAFASEFEFQRYRPRRALQALVADCDLVQVVCGAPAWANAVLGMGKPVSVHVATRAKVERHHQQARVQGLRGWWRKGMTEVTNRLDDRVFRAADAIQLMNPLMLAYAEAINKGRADIDIRYGPPGVDAKRFCPLTCRSSGGQTPYILCVGRLDDPRKNVGLLLRAFQALPAELAHVRLVTAGAGRPPPEYWSQVDALGLAHRVTHRHRPDADELVKLYQHATVLALSSDEEGFGMVVIEAMACGVPVVATRCGGPDGIVADGDSGFLVPLRDAEAMAERLSLLCRDTALNLRMGRAARETIEARYADVVAGQVFVDVWDRLLLAKAKR